MHLRPGDSVHNLVDGAITPRRENQIAAVVDGFRGKFAGALRTRRGKKFDMRARFLENTNGFIQTRASRPFESAGKRVVDESDTMG
jgi:hypothetical protein